MSTRFRRSGFLILSAALVAAPALRAELAPATEVFNVIDEIQNPPEVDPSGGAGVIIARVQPTAVALGGGFAVAWRDEKLVGVEDVMMNDLNGRLVSATGTFGASFAASLPPSSNPGSRRASCPALASLGGGRFMLAWAQNRNYGRDIFGQGFTAAGIPDVAGVHLVGDPSANVYGDLPSLAGRADGKAALSWSEVIRDVQAATAPTLRYNLMSFDAAGAPTTAALRLGSGRQSDRQIRPAVALDAAGVATATWIEPLEGANPQGLGTLWSQRFSAAGVPLAGKARVALRAVDGVALAGAANGQTIVVWARKGQNGAVRLTAGRQGTNGRVIGKVKDLGLVTSFAQPVLLADANGTFALAWIDGDRLKALHLGADLTKRGGTIDVAAAKPELYFTSAHGFGAALENGRLLLAWEGYMPGGICPGNAIQARIFELR